jgi:cytidylate kinase
VAVITIAREFGSEGTRIAEAAARSLGYHLADKGSLEALLEPDYPASERDHEYRSIPGFWERFDQTRMERRRNLLEARDHALRALAAHGRMVILAQGAFVVLAGCADVLQVRIQAPLPVRIRRVAQYPDIAVPSRAERFILENDRIQKGFVEAVYGADWDSAKGFDLVLDTGKLAPELATAWLVLAARTLDAAPAPGPAACAVLAVDPVFSQRVAALFDGGSEQQES